MNRSIPLMLLVVLATSTTLFGSGEILPKPISAELPTYPQRARMARVAGSVWFVLNAEGAVSEAGAISGNPLLRDAALDNLKTWKFSRDSSKANVKYETEYVYRLDVQQQHGEPKLTVSIVDSQRIEIVSRLYVRPIE
jgi:Gram-negative bacterial TonB protein C-terminal